MSLFLFIGFGWGVVAKFAFQQEYTRCYRISTSQRCCASVLTDISHIHATNTAKAQHTHLSYHSESLEG